jgi:sialic acid synthase SpsE
MHTFSFGPKMIGGDAPVCIIAEIGINFDGEFNRAIALIDLAADAGCDAAKFQMFTARRMYPKNAGNYQTASGKTRDIYDIVHDAELPPTWLPKLRDHAHRRGLAFFATVCDEESADILTAAGVDAYKFASYEVTHLPLFRHIASEQRPIIFSSGSATLREVAAAMEVARSAGNEQIVLNHCVGQYPADAKNANLAVLKTFQLAFPDAIIGYSDHTVDPIAAPVAAVALGAKAIEKHITLDRSLPGPDHSFAVDADGLKQMVSAIRSTEETLKRGAHVSIANELLGTSEKVPTVDEQYWRRFAYRCVFATRAIAAGERLTRENIMVLRPGNNARGLDPEHYDTIVGGGYCAQQAISAERSIQWEDVMAVALHTEKIAQVKERVSAEA